MDGRKGGWAGVLLDGDRIEVFVAPAIGALVAMAGPGLDAIGVFIDGVPAAIWT